MEHEKYELILRSLEPPHGLIEIYTNDEFGSLHEQKNFAGHGLGIGYKIHLNDARLQLIATTYDKGRPFFSFEVDHFLYHSHQEMIGIGKQILRGESTGILESMVLKESFVKDTQAKERRTKIGTSLIALGEFAQEWARVQKG